MTTEKQTLTSADVSPLDAILCPPQKFYSAQAGGFFSSEIHDTLPTDAVEISDQQWRDLLDAQEQGKCIQAGADGRPIAVERVQTAEQRTRSLLWQRDAALRGTDWLVSRHRDEMELGGPTTLTTGVYRALQTWRAALRDITQAPEFPDIDLPAKPAGL